MFILADVADAESGYIIQRGTEADGICDISRAGFKSPGRIVKLCFFKSHVFNHISAALPGWHLIQKFFLAIHHANSCRAKYFMSRENKKIRIEYLEVNGHMGNRLCSVQQDFRTRLVCETDDLPGRRNRSQRIGYL